MCVYMSTFNNYVSAAMLLGSSHTFRGDMFMKADTVVVHKKTFFNNAIFYPHCVLRSPTFRFRIFYFSYFFMIILAGTYATMINLLIVQHCLLTLYRFPYS